MPAFSQERLPTQVDSLQRQLAESRELVAKLLRRVDFLEKRLVQLEPDVRFQRAAWSQDAQNAAKSRSRHVLPVGLEMCSPAFQKPTKPKDIRDGIEEGMKIDELQRRGQWQSYSR